MSVGDFGVVVSVKDTIVKVWGLSSVTSGEMVADLNGNVGLVLNLEEKWTGVVMFTDNVLKMGDKLYRLFAMLNVVVDPFMLSNVFDALGKLVNKDSYLGGSLMYDLSREFGSILSDVELKAPGIMDRQPVYEPLLTGMLGVDGLLPLGKGQRELMIGDSQTGKTSMAIDTVLNQSNVDVMVLSQLAFAYNVL